MRRKFLICTVCAVALLLGCAGCGQKAKEETAAQTQEETKGETPRVPPESFGGELPEKPPEDKKPDGEKAAQSSGSGEKTKQTEANVSAGADDAAGKEAKPPKGGFRKDGKKPVAQTPGGENTAGKAPNAAGKEPPDAAASAEMERPAVPKPEDARETRENAADVSDTVLPKLAGRWEQDGGSLVLEFAGSSMIYGYDRHVDGSVNVVARKNHSGEIRVCSSDPSVRTVGPLAGLIFDGDVLRAELSPEGQSPSELTLRRAPQETGGYTDYTDYDAPKTVGSSEIDEFFCTISLISVYLPEEQDLTSRRYEFSAKRDGDAVACVRRSDEGEESFTRDAAFLNKLREIVQSYQLARFNGHSCETHGLPDDFGATLRVSYANGEEIRAFDNQSMYLPLDAVRELVRLFYAAE